MDFISYIFFLLPMNTSSNDISNSDEIQNPTKKVAIKIEDKNHLLRFFQLRRTWGHVLYDLHIQHRSGHILVPWNAVPFIKNEGISCTENDPSTIQSQELSAELRLEFDAIFNPDTNQ